MLFEWAPPRPPSPPPQPSSFAPRGTCPRHPPRRSDSDTNRIARGCTARASLSSGRSVRLLVGSAESRRCTSSCPSPARHHGRALTASMVLDPCRGSTGSVQLAMDRTTGQQVAIKYISRHTMDAKTVLREVRSLRACRRGGLRRGETPQPQRLTDVRIAVRSSCALPTSVPVSRVDAVAGQGCRIELCQAVLCRHAPAR